jgi:hypothetical protein
MKIIYYVEDGYLSGSRPQTIYVDDQDLADCDSAAEKKELIEGAIQDHFESHVSWSCDIDAILSKIPVS